MEFCRNNDNYCCVSYTIVKSTRENKSNAYKFNISQNNEYLCIEIEALQMEFCFIQRYYCTFNYILIKIQVH